MREEACLSPDTNIYYGTRATGYVLPFHCASVRSPFVLQLHIFLATVIPLHVAGLQIYCTGMKARCFNPCGKPAFSLEDRDSSMRLPGTCIVSSLIPTTGCFSFPGLGPSHLGSVRVLPPIATGMPVTLIFGVIRYAPQVLQPIS